MNNDLTNFNLKEAGFSVSTQTVREGGDHFFDLVVIFNLKEGIAFDLPVELKLDKSWEMAERVFKKGFVDLTQWNPSEFLEFTDQSDIDSGWTKALSYDCEEFSVEDEDGEIAYRQKLEREAQEFADIDNQYRGI